MKRIALLCFALLALLVIGAPISAVADTGPPAFDVAPLELVDAVVADLNLQAATDIAPALVQRGAESFDELETVRIELDISPLEPVDRDEYSASSGLRPPPRAVRCRCCGRSIRVGAGPAPARVRTTRGSFRWGAGSAIRPGFPGAYCG